jgi:hypothetical protein
MKSLKFPEASIALAEDQPEYETLHVYPTIEEVTMQNGSKKPVVMELTACFSLSPEEIAEINRTGVIWYTQCVYGHQFQPVRMSTQNPFIQTEQTK